MAGTDYGIPTLMEILGRLFETGPHARPVDPDEAVFGQPTRLPLPPRPPEFGGPPPVSAGPQLGPFRGVTPTVGNRTLGPPSPIAPQLQPGREERFPGSIPTPEQLAAILYDTGLFDAVPGPGMAAVPARVGRTIAEVRAALEGAPSLRLLAQGLEAVPPKYAHHVTKGYPIPEPLNRMREILVPAPDRGLLLSPEADERAIELTRIADLLPQQSNWGGATDPALTPAFSGDPHAADLFGRIWAAMSPGTSVPKNTQEAVKVWREYLRKPGTVWPDDVLRSLGAGNTRSKTDNIIRAILGEDPSGPKVDPMTDFMIGKASPVPDVHHMYGVGSRHTTIAQALPEIRAIVEGIERTPTRGAGRLSNKEIVQRFSDAVAETLRGHDPLRGMGPLFGSFWEGVRAQKGLAHQGGMIDILGRRGLTEPGAMFSDEALTRAIEDARPWTVQPR